MLYVFGRKIRVAKQLETLGVDIIEAGFPIASDGDFQSVKEIAKLCKTTRVAALARTVEADVLQAAEALKPAAKSRPRRFLGVAMREILGGRLSIPAYLASLNGPLEHATMNRDDPLPGILEVPITALVHLRRRLRSFRSEWRRA